MALALGEQRVEDPAGVVAGHEPHQPDVAGLGVDLDHGHVDAERVGRLGTWRSRARRQPGARVRRAATSAQERDRGVPTTWKRPAAASCTTSSSAASSSSAARRGPARRPRRRRRDRRPAQLERPRADRAGAARTASVSPWRTSIRCTGRPARRRPAWRTRCPGPARGGEPGVDASTPSTPSPSAGPRTSAGELAPADGPVVTST